MFQKDYEFDDAFNIFHVKDNKCMKFNEYKPRATNKCNTKRCNKRVFQNYER